MCGRLHTDEGGHKHSLDGPGVEHFGLDSDEEEEIRGRMRS